MSAVEKSGRSVKGAGARAWLFDLDNTLHDADAHIFPRLGYAMREYIGRLLNLDEAPSALDTESELHILRQTHQFHDLASLVVAERGLKAMLERLPGRKIIFSNAPFSYTRRILAITGIGRCFYAVYSIERLRFKPKPATQSFLRLLRIEGLAARSCIMVEHSLPNLRTAKRLGMTTVWVHPGTRRPPYADVQVASVLELPRRLRQI